jgi:DNA-binding response OmpR family regulator
MEDPAGRSGPGSGTVNELVLIVEDEPDFGELLELWIGRTGYRTTRAGNGRDALVSFHELRPDLVVLDVSLPGFDGWQVLERIREVSRIPVLMVTARSAEGDKVRGLRLGADDYVTKPVGFPELMARIEGALRRAQQAPPERAHQLQQGDLVIDLDDHRVRLRSQEVRLTPTEFRLLVFFAERSGQLVTHRHVLTGVWGAGYGNDVHLLRMTVRNLRAKLAGAAPGESWIATEYGLGYRLSGPSSSAPLRNQ